MVLPDSCLVLVQKQGFTKQCCCKGDRVAFLLLLLLLLQLLLLLLLLQLLHLPSRRVERFQGCNVLKLEFSHLAVWTKKSAL